MTIRGDSDDSDNHNVAVNNEDKSEVAVKNAEIVSAGEARNSVGIGGSLLP
jgi:hypothetical protein